MPPQCSTACVLMSLCANSLSVCLSPGCVLLQVKKIYENQKRLQAGEHSLDLLAHDFEKNYNMYIFPVHWQFGQLDQHPIDG